MSKSLQLLLILLINNLSHCQSSYIKTDEAAINDETLTIEIVTNPTFNQHLVTESMQESVPTTTLTSQEDEGGIESHENQSLTEISDSLESHILTGDLFIISMTIKSDWKDEFLDKKSKTFQTLSRTIETDLTSFFDNELNLEDSILRENFMLENVLPSSRDGYIYVIIVVESTQHVTGQIIYDKLDLQLRIFNKIYELETIIDGFSVKAVSHEELKKFDQHVECDNEFCKSHAFLSVSTPDHPITSEEFAPTVTVLESSQESIQCHPNENIRKGSTSIYIFDNSQKCLENVKEKSLLKNSQSCSIKSGDNVKYEKDELAGAASEIHSQSDEPVDDKDDGEVVVVIRKKGDKVLIEI